MATGAFSASAILAVTFTDKAAGEMRARLEALGVRGVRARTFHSSALAQLHHLVPGTGEILPSKALWLRQIANGLPVPYRFRPAADLATEIEWARNRRLTPASYSDGLDGHEPPIPLDLMLRVFRRYEERKQREGRIDFEDVLDLLVRFYDAHPDAAERFRARCAAITVDEYQDVNLLQQALLDHWLGDRDELCAVGDDYQAIYSFTGATPHYLLELPKRFPNAAVVRLETNYRSTPQVLAVANRLVPALGGARKELRPIAGDGPEPVLQVSDDEGGWIAQRIAELHRDQRVPYEEVAVVYRVNARSEDFEEALADAGIPYQVRGGAFLSRPAARSVLRRLGRGFDIPAGTATAEAARLDGLLEQLPEGLGEEERTRQADLRRLVQLADAFDGSAADFAADLARRFGSEGEGRGVHLLTYHRAKGLEWDAVFLPALAAGELPARQAKTKTAIDEERRLLYVGITRARRFLFLSRPAKAKPSPFLVELGLEGRSKRRASAPGGREAAGRAATSDPDGPFGALRAWRKDRAQADGVPAYVVFHDRTLEELAARLPRGMGELLDVPGVGPAKVERYGSEVLAVLARFVDP